MLDLYGEPTGAFIQMQHSCQMEWIVNRVFTPPHLRGRGLASALLKQVTADADELGITLYLTASPDLRGLDRDQLEAWYRRNGFVDDVDPYILVRRPR